MHAECVSSFSVVSHSDRRRSIVEISSGVGATIRRQTIKKEFNLADDRSEIANETSASGASNARGILLDFEFGPHENLDCTT